MQTEWGRSAYTSPHWRKLEIALIQQLFLLPDEASHIKGIEHVLLVFRHTMQTEEFTRVLRIIASKESGNLALPSAQQITEKIALYMEEDAYDIYQERLTTLGLFLEKVPCISSFSPEALACIYLYRGRIYGKYKRGILALADLDRALALAPQYTQALRRRGATYQRMGRYAETIADFDSVLALDEQDQWTLGMRGETYGCHTQFCKWDSSQKGGGKIELYTGSRMV